MGAAARVFRFDDWGGVNALHRSVSWPERSPEGWRWLLDNPVALANPEHPGGWVIETPEGLGASIGNFLQTLWIGNQAHLVASGHSIVISPGLKGASRTLVPTLLHQAGVTATYTFNANPLSSPLLTRFGMEAWPTPTHGLKLSWTLDPLACALGRINRVMDRLGGDDDTPRPERLVNRRLGSPPSLRLADGVEALTDFSDQSDFAELWTRLRAEGGVVMDRSPATLRWRLTDPDQRTRPLLLAMRRGQSLTGYAWAMMVKDDAAAAPALDIIDLVALKSDPDAIQALFDALLSNAHALGAARLRLQVVNPAILAALGDRTRKARREGGWGHCHVLFRSQEHTELLRAGWRPTPFDGDYSFCLRSAPGRTPRSPAI